MTAQAQIKASFPVRRMDFGFNDVPKYWFHDDPFLTHFLSNLSSLFPEGEFFFVTSMRNIRDQIDDPVMQKEISAFIGQEAMHSKEHKVFNDYATAHGVDVDYFHRRVGKLLKFGHKILSHKQQLAVTCALEHFTAIMAEGFLTNPEMFDGMAPSMRQLWLWHAVEENEHKGVAFDVYQEQVGDYWIRVRAMALTTVMFMFNQARFQTRLLHEDGELFKPAQWLKGVNRLWGRKGWFRQMIPAYLEYYRRDFHPWQSDTRELLEKWKQELRLDERAIKKAA